MKASHFTTPRQLADASFVPSADPIERPQGQPYEWHDLAIAAIAVGTLVLIALGVA